jgi:hypothetical protein
MEATLRRGTTPDALGEATGVDQWFVDQLQRITREAGRARSPSQPGSTERTAGWKASGVGTPAPTFANVAGDGRVTVWWSA